MCLNPTSIRSKAVDALPGQRQLVRCGKCLECLRENQREWIYRLEKEQEVSKHSIFGTLTYSPANVPLINAKTLEIKPYKDLIRNKCIDDVELSINKKDVVDYWKRVRDKLQYLPLKHYSCMEYGDEFGRPHNHFAVFYNDADPSFFEKVLVDSWQDKGYVQLSPLFDSRVSYLTKYLKKGDAEAAPSDLSPDPDSLKSHGIGVEGFLKDEKRWQNYYDELYYYCDRVHDFSKLPVSENIPFVTTHDGEKLSVPRYFRRRFFEHEDFLTEKIIEQNERRETKQKLAEVRKVQDLRIKGYHWDTEEVWPSMVPNYDFDRIKRDVYKANARRRGK